MAEKVFSRISTRQGSFVVLSTPSGLDLLMVELYDAHRARRWRDTLSGIGLAALISAGLYLVIFFISRDPESLPRKGVAIFIIAITILTILWRLLYIRIFTAPQFMRRMLIVGAGKSGRALVKVIKEIWPQPFFLVGLVDDDPQKIGLKIYDLRFWVEATSSSRSSRKKIFPI